MPVAVVAGVALAAGAAASAVAKKKAADRAASIQKQAVNQQRTLLEKKLDPTALNTLAQKADAERAQNRLNLQQKIDPELAALRQTSKEQLLAQANVPESQKQSTQLANTLFNETKAQDPKLAALKDSLISAAQKEIDAGATLPPEFQAELVRAGLNNGSQAGIALDKNSIGGGIARALGFSGIQLQQQRQQQAQQLAGSAQNLVNARVNILSSVFPKLRDLESSQRNESVQNFQLADQAVPESGLSGQDVVNLRVAQQKGIANAIGSTAAIRANQATNQGNFVSGLIGAGTQVATAGTNPTGILGSIFNGGGSSAPTGTISGNGVSQAPGSLPSYY